MDGTTTTPSGGAGEEQWVPDVPTADQPQLLATAVGDQCANCGARLAGDQRYCVECGERRGKPRYSLPGSGGNTSTRPASARRQRRTLSGNSALLGGIAVLLIAMGVGVLIGRTSSSSSPRGAAQVITVQASAPATAGPAATTTPTTSSTPNTPSRSSKASTPKKVTPKNAAASLAAKLPPKAKVIPKALKSKAVKVGGACTNGTKGCQNGKFTGVFFGGG
jgi:hypothetical protein